MEERCPVARELYLSISVDRLAGCPLILACAEGGVEIEDVAAVRPGAVVRRHVDVLKGLRAHEALQVAKQMGLKGDDAVALGRFLQEMYAAFVRLDTHLLEVNPLVVTAPGKLVAADAKVILDDDAAFRQPFIKDETSRSPGSRRWSARAGEEGQLRGPGRRGGPHGQRRRPGADPAGPDPPLRGHARPTSWTPAAAPAGPRRRTPSAWC